MKIKFITIITITIMSSLFIAGCNTVSANTAINPTSVSTVNNESFNIKTSGGVVLVGTIIKNVNDEYCIKLNDKIDFELNYFIDHPEFFKDCDEILLYEKSDDGIDKSIYKGKQVTIKGVLQNYRGAGRLYAYICDIEPQMQTDICHADENIQIEPTEECVSDFDPSLPLPKKIMPITNNGTYVFNPYTLNINTLRHFGNDFVNFYIDFVDAYLNYETSVHCPNEYYANMFTTILPAEFPLFISDAEIDPVTCYDKNTNRLHWSYKTQNKDEHNKIMNNFKKQINNYLSDILSSDSNIVKAEKLYHNFCSKMTYNTEAVDSRKKIEPYYGLTEHRGICYTFSYDYLYLLSMVGIESNIVSANVETNNIEETEAHMWNLVLLNDKYYFCDPTYELSYKNGSAFVYFGTTLEDRLNDNTKWITDSIRIGIYDQLTLDQINLSTSTLQIAPIR